MTWNNWREKAIKKYPDIESQYQSLSLNKSLLHFAMEQKAILPKEYLKWALKEFKIPTLKDDFIPTDEQLRLWKKWNNHNFTWTQSALPLYEWDHCLYVLAFEPYSQTQIHNYTVISILGTPEKMSELWTYYHSQEDLLLESLESENSEELSVPSEIETPEGFGEMSFSPNISSNDENEFLQTVILERADIKPMIPMDSKTIEKKQVHVQERDLDEDLPPSTQLIDLKALNQQVEVDEDVPPSTQLIDLKNMNMQAEDEDVPPSTQRIDLAALGLMPTSAQEPAIQTFKAPRNFPDYYFLDAVQKKYGPELHTKMDQVFSHIKKSYKNVAIFCVNKAESEAQIFKLDSSFPSTLECAIKLDKPSIFRILQKTGKSFHGPVSPSALNDHFVKTFFAGSYPENLTGTPLMTNEVVIGYIIATGTSQTYTKKHLDLCEEMAQFLSATLTQILKKEENSAA